MYCSRQNKYKFKMFCPRRHSSGLLAGGAKNRDYDVTGEGDTRAAWIAKPSRPYISSLQIKVTTAFVCNPVTNFCVLDMGKRCIAGGCSNTHKECVGLFSFPIDERLRRIWTQKVKQTRQKWHGPTAHSVLCSAHFSADCFAQDENPARNELMASFNIKFRTARKLKPSAIPTILKKAVTPKKRPKPSIRKREIAQKIDELRRSSVAAPSTSWQTINTELTIDHDEAPVKATAKANKPVRSVKLQTNMARFSRTKGTQTTLTMIDMETDTTDIEIIHPETELDETTSSDSDADTRSLSSSDYAPSSSNASDVCTSDLEEDLTTNPNDTSALMEPKYIVFNSALQELFAHFRCPKCGEAEVHHHLTTLGTALMVSFSCTACFKKTVWRSQPQVGAIPAGNILLSSAILCAGASATKVLRVLKHMNVTSITKRTFFRQQTDVILPSILSIWDQQRICNLGALYAEGRPLIIGGDGRADSPGHCAKFGTYTSLELEANLIIDLQLVQSNECGGSYHMELEGLRRALETLENHGLIIGALVTDRHRQIGKWLRENHSNVQHLFDVWHLAKGLSKKFLSLSNERGCFILREWIPSLLNHLYWCVMSSQRTESDLLLEKWRSLLRHITNVHVRHGALFEECEHGVLEGREAKKKWLEPNSKVYEKLDGIVNNRSLIKDLPMLSNNGQTSNIEAFHSLTTQFAPKMIVFSYAGMYCRTILAALHYNENANRCQAKRKDGTLRHSIHFPKWKKGGFVVKKIKEDATFGYVEEVIERVLEQCKLKRADRKPVVLRQPPSLNSMYVHPNKEVAVSQHTTRFSH